ncbi:MAG: YwaF family protein [Oscillospiraceae bacterium]|nr:YwaF family protein [Oscillospiraceae bacterium]
MKWGNFTPVHFASLAIGALIILAIFLILRKRSQTVQTAVLGVLSFAGIAAIIYNMLPPNNVLQNLPLQLCSLNAMLLPIVVFTKNKTLGNLLLAWCLGAICALILNNECVNMDIFGLDFAFYYYPHLMECGIPILLFALGHIKKDPKCILSSLVISLAAYTVIHFINLWINDYAAANDLGFSVNYMFSMQPNNPLSDLLYSLVPYKYFYMLLYFPLIAVYLAIVYLPDMIRSKKVGDTGKK